MPSNEYTSASSIKKMRVELLIPVQRPRRGARLFSDTQSCPTASAKRADQALDIAEVFIVLP